jgi:hypothetical protein
MNAYSPHVLTRLARKHCTAKTARGHVALAVETLEDRLVPATFNVNSFAICSIPRPAWSPSAPQSKQPITPPATFPST